MANYFLDENGSLTTAKKKKKQGKNYLLQNDGSVVENVMPKTTTQNTLQTPQLTDIELRTQAERNIAQKFGTYEQFAAEQSKGKTKVMSDLADKTSKTMYQKLIEEEKNRLASGSEFYGITNKGYQEYLDNFSKNAKDEQQTAWLEQQRKNLDTLKNSDIRETIEKAVYNEKISGGGSKKSRIDILSRELNITREQAESLYDTVEREQNAKHSKTLEENADKMTEKGFLGKAAAHFLSIGANIESTLGILDSIGKSAKNKITGEYAPIDTNAPGYAAGNFRDRARGNIEADIVGGEGEDAPLWRKGLGTIYQGASSAFDSLGQAMVFGPTGAMLAMGGQAATGTAKETFERTGSNSKAITTGLVSGGIEALTEKMGLDNMWDILQNSGKAALRSTLVNILAQSGIEGVEEMTSEALNTVADYLINQTDSNISKSAEGHKESGLSDKEAWKKAFSEAAGQVGKAGLTGTVAGIFGGAAGSALSTSYSKNEKQVIEKEVERRISEKQGKVTAKEKAEIRKEVQKDLEKGYIDIDTIESTLGGKTYDSYQNLSKEMEEYRSLNKMKAMELTGEQSDRLAELKEKNKNTSYESEQARLKEQLSKEVSDMTVNDRFLRESYNEKGRRSQAFEADVNTYDEKQRSIIQNAIDSGILNNTRRTHEFVDMIAKISADKGVSFDFTDNQRLKESGFAKEGISVNGYIKDGNVTLNVNSAKALNKVVGHEITHVLEGSDLYAELQEAVKAYATTKGEYKSKLEAITKLYEGVEGANVEQELTADLIGEYLFTDEAFVQQLSAQNRNIFQKIYDEIKYLCKVVSSGSKEAKQLEKVKRAFDKAYKENNSNTTDSNTLYSISEASKGEGREIIKIIEDNLDKIKKDNVFSTKYDATVEAYNKKSDYVLEIFEKQGNKAHNDKIGVVELVKSGAKSTISHGFGKDKLASVSAIKDVIENGTIIHSLLNHKGSGVDRYIIAARGVIEEKPACIGVVVKSYPKTNGNAKFYLHEAKIIETNKADLSSMTAPQLSVDTVDKSASNNIISKDTKNTTENHKFSISPENINKLTDEGITMTYVRVSNQNTKNYGSTYGQNIEPAGEYMSMDTSRGKNKIEGYEYGTIQFKRPLVLEHINTSDTGWKKTVSDMYGGLTGKKLSQALVKDGYDAILTYDEYGYNEIVNLKGTKLNGNGHEAFSLSTELPIRSDIAPTGKWNVKGSDITLDDSTPIRKDIAPAQKENLTDGPFTMDDAESTPEDEEAIQFKEVNKRKVKNIQAKIQGLQVSKDVTKKEFSESIEKKKEEYEGLKRKDTVKASKLLEQITNLEYRRDNTIAELDRKIEGQRKAMENIKKQEVARQRKRKQNELQNRVRELIGDTSTWKDKKNGISYQVNTLRRNLRDVVRDADGNRDIAKADEIYDALQGKYNINEAELNREANRIKQVFADLKINAAENTYIQMLGEYRHNPDTTISAEVIGEYYEKHKSKIDNAKVDKAIETARKLYDSLFYRVNSVLREQGMQEIGYREGYFPHFTEEKQGVLAKIFNWKTQNNDIPTDIAGLTEHFKPNRSWQSFNKHRTGDDTDYNFMKGLDNYVNGALDWIYHIEDIQMRRALENEIRYRHSEKGIQEKIDAIYSNPFYDADEAQAEIDKILDEAENPLNNFVQDLQKGTNVLAGKKDSGDRNIEQKTSRKIYSTMTNISNRVTANMVAGSVSSALTNFIPITQSWGQVSPVSSVIGMAETIKSYVVDDGTVNKSNFLTNRLRKNENLYQTGWDKAGNAIGFMMEAVDDFTSQTVWRSKYMENIKNGMSETEAIKDADQFAENVIAGRSRGNMPTIFNEKNLITKMFTAFQLEVGNQYGYMLKDMPQDMQNQSKAKLIKGYASMFVGAYVYNALYSKLTGRDAAFDPFRILQELLGDLFGDDEEEGSITDAITNLATNIVEETPFIGGLVGGGRIPISSALPYEGLSVETLTGVMNDLSEGNMKNFWQEILKPVYYVAMPMGGGQTRKTIQGLQMFDDDLPIAGSYTNSGKLRFSVDDDIPTRIQAAVFGQYANENAREYFDEGRTPLSEKKTKELVDLDIPISEYWDIQDGLKEHEKLADKIDYVADLDLPIDKKNVLANNLTKRKEPVDLTDYDLYGNIEELDFATSNPEKYKVAKAVGGYSSYKTYTKELNNIKANKGKNGKAISGSRKTKVVNYLNGLSADYGTKLILFKREFPGDDTYNKAIVEYLNKRDDLSYSDVETILKELGFTVDSKGNVRW